MSKTPYEIRFDLLAMAQSIITENLMNERIRLENDWNVSCEKIRTSAIIGKQANFPPFPNVPNVDPNQIIDLAKKLNEFVSKTGE